MIYNAQILHLDEIIEEKAVLLIEGVSLTCFVSVCPYPIKEGLMYPVDLSLWSLDGLELSEAAENEQSSISRLGAGFSYSLTGRLNNGGIEIGGLLFTESEFATDFQFLEGKIVTVVADRLQVEFTKI